MDIYISSNIAAWRILVFEIHWSFPAVYAGVYVTEVSASNVVNYPPGTTFTGFLKLCSTDSFAEDISYVEDPSFYTWSNKQWQCRQMVLESKGPMVKLYSKVIRPAFLIPFHQGKNERYFCECCYLASKDLNHLLMFGLWVKCEISSTFWDTCLKHGLLEVDSLYDTTLRTFAGHFHSNTEKIINLTNFAA